MGSGPSKVDSNVDRKTSPTKVMHTEHTFMSSLIKLYFIISDHNFHKCDAITIITYAFNITQFVYFCLKTTNYKTIVIISTQPNHYFNIWFYIIIIIVKPYMQEYT